jgi:lysozyme
MTPLNLLTFCAELRRDENSSAAIYMDDATPPNPTIGVGHNLNASPLPDGWTIPLTQSQIQQLLILDIQTKAFKPLNQFLPWWNTLDDVRQRIFANMAFNEGIGHLLGFKLMLAAVQSKNWAGAASEMENSLWYKQVGQRAIRLCEAMKTGVMP